MIRSKRNELVGLWIFTLFVLSCLYYLSEKRNEQYHINNRNVNYLNDIMTKNNLTQQTKYTIENMNEAIIEAISSHDAFRVYINEQIVYASPVRSVGISMVVLNPNTLKIINTYHFNTYSSKADADALLYAIKTSEKHSLIILGVVDEGSLELNDAIRLELSRQGSTKIRELTFRSMWSMIFIKDKFMLDEEISQRKMKEDWPRLIHVYASLSPQKNIISLPMIKFKCNNWPTNDSFNRRTKFCVIYAKEFPDICDCYKPSPIDFIYKPLNNAKLTSSSNANHINSVLEMSPIAIMSSSRPMYLMRCIQRLLSIDGTRKNMITVYTDSKNKLNIAIAKLFEMNLYYTPKKCTPPCAIGLHYRSMLMDITKKHPQAPEIIIIEEDLLVSLDFFYYFSQVLPFYRKNEHYYCVSAWNDQSYNHTTGDYKMLYLTHTMPGLGFAIKYSTVVNDWLASWPKSREHFDWDYFVRADRIRKGRECIVPDISRTFHFGEKGYSINPHSQQVHFNTRPAVMLQETYFDTSWIEDSSYESIIIDLVKHGKAVKSNSLAEICAIGDKAYKMFMHVKLDQISPNHQPTNGIKIDQLRKNTQIIYLKMNNAFNQVAWRKISTCWKIWTMDERDFHFGALRIWFSGIHYVVVMCPLSKYCEYKPDNITPIPIS